MMGAAGAHHRSSGSVDKTVHFREFRLLPDGGGEVVERAMGDI